MKRTFVVHPFLFALFHIIFLYSHNIEQVFFSDILLPLAIVLGMTFLLVLLLRLIFKESQKIAIFISVAIVLFFSYGHIYNLIVDWYIGSFEIGRHRYLFILWGLLFTYSIFLTVRTRRDLHNFTNTLNIMALSLVLISLFNIGVYELKLKNIRQDTYKRMECLEITTTDLGDVDVFRDIYYIILDGYASSNTLNDIFNYDNQDFTDYLEEKGFYIATKSRSNYPTSFLSLSSSLNMQYVNYLTEVVGVESTDPKLPYQMIKNNNVMNLLKLRGYQFIHFSSGWGPTNRNRHAGLDFYSTGSNEFQNVLVQTTLLKTIEKLIIIDVLSKSKLNTFSKLAGIHKIDGPKFVFAHIISPHPPYLFDENGERIPGAEFKMNGNIWSKKEDYVNQLIFINKKVKELVDKILLKSEIPPILILQADHGPASTFPDLKFFWKGRPSEKMLRERMGILNAYFLPSGGSELLYESITPVNTFRLIFDFYFDMNYGLLNDQSYYSTYEHPYEFINVTDKVKYH